MAKMNKVLLGILGAVAALLLAVLVTASILLPYYQITVDKFFLGQGASFETYDPAAARVVCEELEGESQVLLKNNGLLPLEASEASPKKVVLLGMGSAHMRYAGSGSGGGNATGADTLYDALPDYNILPYREVHDFYYSRGSTGSTGGFGDVGTEIGSTELNIDSLSNTVKEGAKAWSDTAIYVLTRVGGEGSEISANLLGLMTLEERTLDFAVQNFEHVIVLLNISNQMELGFLDGKGTSRATGESFEKYAGKIDAALWIGLPGYTGANAVAAALAGAINPSGRLSDTYAYDVNSAPAASAVGNAEGIYLGYRWYETAAFEGVMDYDAYQRTQTVPFATGEIATGVQYPFGYGMSYGTDFTKEIVDRDSVKTSFRATDANKEISVKVKVTNNGTRAGKEVVQLYYTAPYTDGGIEKPYVTLAAFEKTGLLYPAAQSDADHPHEETVTLTFKLSDMKSFDASDANGNGFKGYELEQGTYLLRVLDNAHGWTAVGEDSPLCIPCEVTEDLRYTEDDKTGNAVSARFGAFEGARAYLSRAGHFANLSANLSENDENLTYSDPDISAESNNYTRGTDYEVALQKPILFGEMRGVDYDDPMWETFISQLSKAEMANLIAMGNFQTQPVERLEIPKTLLFDGPAAIKDTYRSDFGCLLYPSEVTLASSWSKEMMKKFGASAGDDARQTGVTGWYAPGVNLHKSAYGSRNFEYFSECPVLSGELAACVAQGAREEGLIVVVKHLLDGVTSTVNEQSLREIYARPFEIAIKKGNAQGLMTSSGLLGTWIGQVKEFITDIVRGEWGFVGLITSDAASAAMKVEYGIRAGNDLWLATDNARYTYLVRTEKNIPAMQQACKNILYTISQSPNTFSTDLADAGWSPAMLILGLVDAVAALGIFAAGFFIVRHVLSVRNKNAIHIRTQGGDEE